MKKTLQILKMLLMIAILICSAQSSWAQYCIHDKNNYPSADYPNQNWVDSLVKVAPNTLLRDMSIVRSHDAATWSGNLLLSSDQYYCERDLFKKGVRAFDMRLITRIDGNNVTFKFSHGGDQQKAGFDVWEDFKSFDDEIDNHFPTYDDIKKEFLIIYFKWEGDDDKGLNQDRRRAALLEFVKKVADKYGKENIIRFKKDLTVKDMQGKVLLISETHYSVIEAMYTYPFETEPLMTFEKEHDYSGYADVPIAIDGDIDGVKGLYDLKNKTSSFEKLSYYGDYEAKRINKKESVKKHLYSWFNKLKENNNQTDGYHFVTLNSYWFNTETSDHVINAISGIFGLNLNWQVIYGVLHENPDRNQIYQTGWDMCSDYDDNPGVNHVAYDVLNRWYLPFGMISYDYCGTSSVKERNTYGNELLNLCVKNNFRILPKTNQKPFIKEICVARDADRQTTQSTMLNNGFMYIDLQANQGLTGNGVVYIGYKTTDKFEESVSDVIVVKTTSPAQEITIGDKTYQRALNSLGTSNTGNIWKGNSEQLYVYYSKNDANSSVDGPALTVLDLKQANSRPGAANTAQCYIKSGDNYVKSDDLQRVSGNITNPVYLTYSLHEHEYYLDSDDSQRHRECCTLCPKVKSINQHKFAYTPDVYGKHIISCDTCGYVMEESENCESNLKQNGFGECKQCHSFQMAIPTRDEDGTALISNAGQLFAFSVLAYALDDLNAKLTADIDFGEDAEKWIPIGINSQKRYKGTFDGQGHIIKGIQRPETVEGLAFDGLFGTTDGAVIKNVGVAGCYFLGTDSAGVFVASPEATRVENCFSDSQAFYKSHSDKVKSGDIYGKLTRFSYVSNSCVLNEENQRLFHFAETGIDVDSYVTNVYATYSAKGVTQLTSERYALGDLCNRLNTNVTAHNKNNPGDWVTWRQTLGKDAAPTFGTTGIDYERNMSNTWGTLVLPYKVQSDGAIQYYKIKSSNISGTEGTITLEEVSEVEANTPCIFKRLTENEALTFANKGGYSYVHSITPVTTDGITLNGTYDQLTNKTGIYFLAQNKFWYAADPISINPYRSWFTYNSVSNAKAYSINILVDEDGETTQIGEIRDGELNMYDGKYLENGRIIIKKNNRKYNLNGQEIN